MGLTRRPRAIAAAVAALSVTVCLGVLVTPSLPQGMPRGGAAAGGLVRAPDHLGDPHDAIIAVRTRRPIVALTFDDGPDPRFTPQVLRLLRASHAHATFFAIGRRIGAHPQLARAIVAAGNEVADHTLDHVLLPPLSEASIRHQIAGGLRAARRAGLPATPYFRPPHGFFDARVSLAAARLGLRTIGWNAVVERALRGRTPARAAAFLAATLEPGSIVLAHDGRNNRSSTVAAVARLLPALRARGIRVVSVSELLAARS